MCYSGRDEWPRLLHLRRGKGGLALRGCIFVARRDDVDNIYPNTLEKDGPRPYVR